MEVLNSLDTAEGQVGEDTDFFSVNIDDEDAEDEELDEDIIDND